MHATDNIETNTRSVHYRSPSDLCTFCGRLRETTLHLFWDCDIVKNFRIEVMNNISNANNLFRQKLTTIPNTAKARILGNHTTKPDNFAFIFYLSLIRYIWITKLREGIPNIIAFKNFFNAFTKLQKNAKILRCLNNFNSDLFWTLD